MSHEAADAAVLAHVAWRLFGEGRALYREAHETWSEGCNATTPDEYMRKFGEALGKEGLALKMQCEAIELQREADGLRAKAWDKLKAQQGG